MVGEEKKETSQGTNFLLSGAERLSHSHPRPGNGCAGALGHSMDVGGGHQDAEKKGAQAQSELRNHVHKEVPGRSLQHKKRAGRVAQAQ